MIRYLKTEQGGTNAKKLGVLNIISFSGLNFFSVSLHADLLTFKSITHYKFSCSWKKKKETWKYRITYLEWETFSTDNTLWFTVIPSSFLLWHACHILDKYQSIYTDNVECPVTWQLGVHWANIHEISELKVYMTHIVSCSIRPFHSYGKIPWTNLHTTIQICIIQNIQLFKVTRCYSWNPNAYIIL